MLGAIIGDIVGSIYERNNIKTKDFQLFSAQSTFTDDTVCMMAVADCLLNNKEYSITMRKWGKKYLPITGFSKKFTLWIQNPDMRPYEGKTNGAVMKMPPLAYLIQETTQALKIADDITKQTHNHPDSIAAVHAFIETVHACRNEQPIQQIRTHLSNVYGYDMNRSVDEIRTQYDKFYVSCTKSVPEALICALEATSFEDAIRNAISIGGDSDTIACIAGAVAEARFPIPYIYREAAFCKLPEEMQDIVQMLYPNKCIRRQRLKFSTQITERERL